jgi:hypothetical protein
MHIYHECVTTSCIQKFDNFKIDDFARRIVIRDSFFVNMAKTVTMLSL